MKILQFGLDEHVGFRVGRADVRADRVGAGRGLVLVGAGIGDRGVVPRHDLRGHLGGAALLGRMLGRPQHPADTGEQQQDRDRVGD